MKQLFQMLDNRRVIPTRKETNRRDITDHGTARRNSGMYGKISMLRKLSSKLRETHVAQMCGNMYWRGRS